MKLTLTHKNVYGKDRFYPVDEFTTKLLEVFRADCNKAKCYTRKQISALMALGFEIDIQRQELSYE